MIVETLMKNNYVVIIYWNIQYVEYFSQPLAPPPPPYRLWFCENYTSWV